MTDNQQGRPANDRRPRPKRKAAAQNPIEAAVLAWLGLLPQDTSTSEAATQHQNPTLLAQAPRRWTVYEPMVLLPTGSLSSPEWSSLLSRLGQQNPAIVQNLWQGILTEISRKTGAKQPLTHLAINEGIPLVRDQNQQQPEQSQDNILRSPSGLAMLYGDFGPSLGSRSDIGSISSQATPTDDDFEKAFWVSTKQNGICQTWAPRWTMFSRGNIKEKARLLDFHASKNSSALPKSTSNDSASETLSQQPDGKHDGTIASTLGIKLRSCYAVDMYAGIGYFVFSYARLGLRVLCWEINPWSVEGLRRGAEANGWTVRVVRTEEELARPTPELVPRTRDGGYETGKRARVGPRTRTEEAAQIVVFLEDNKHAARRIAELREAWQNKTGAREADNDASSIIQDRNTKVLLPAAAQAQPLEVLHVNGGLLPASTGSWPGAWDVTSTSQDAWLHLHENVGVADVERRKTEIELWFRDYQDQQRSRQSAEGTGSLSSSPEPRRAARVEHVELVKTFAPDVWHCVFDVYVTSRVNEGPSGG
ncbi:S-adenosyl-L-methionine-dependent methyltransferase [Microdochium bolleyi]|uniref:tRNA(Phe) (4-demethylwyosine(37)-C(7)) aminocarboxypropyltransferase n=1 Tax=Microdochium bolleyi TaxID=196109 RepID=A0A136JGW8_9PEZI|nr:S-adenosyl-L-methionine-dependent methyltransferase [Microdochium bolleyi]